ncbi:hypothetical protein ACN42_g1193 [Penicillium freii]|uniref:Uncharacterized protein n=1 Tax=Penicillium freii TaxID=48697 RepID=A0A117NRS1_PENFR|nr:hypothetical protein ACN42_g1193 [Penicillium freii]
MAAEQRKLLEQLMGVSSVELAHRVAIPSSQLQTPKFAVPTLLALARTTCSPTPSKTSDLAPRFTAKA